MTKIVTIGRGGQRRVVGRFERFAHNKLTLGPEMEQPVTDTISDSSGDPSEREFGPSGISLSPYRFPTGWFIVGFASELAPGAVKRVHYFGEEMVLFRTESGEVHVLDAYCQHLGANMGVGGTVEGENIV